MVQACRPASEDVSGISGRFHCFEHLLISMAQATRDLDVLVSTTSELSLVRLLSEAMMSKD